MNTRANNYLPNPELQTLFHTDSLSHFSAFGMTQEEGESTLYCAGFYYNRNSPTLQRVHFVIAKDVNLEELTKVSYLDFMTP